MATNKKTTKKAPARAKAAAKTSPSPKAPKATAEAPKAAPKNEAPKAPPRAKEPPPKVRKRGKVTEVEFQSMDQVREIAGKAVEGKQAFTLSGQEIAARVKETSELLEALGLHRGKLETFTKERDATKARIDSTPDGQKLAGLKESVKNQDTIIAALQKRFEEAAYEAIHGKTYNPQRELFRGGVELNIPEGGVGSAKDRTAPLPLDDAPPPAPPAPEPKALPPVTSAVIVEGVIEEIPLRTHDVGMLLQAKGPLTIEQICAEFGWEERESGNWKDVLDALRALHAIKQGDGRWYLPEHLRALPPPAPPPVDELPALPAAPTLSTEERLQQIAVSEEPLRERMRSAMRLLSGTTHDALHQLLGGNLEELQDQVGQLVEQGDVVNLGGVLYPAEALRPESLRAAVLADVKRGPATAGALQGLLCPPHSADALAEMLRALVASGDLVLGDDETYSLPTAPPPANGAGEASAPARARGKAERGAAAPSAAAAATAVPPAPEKPSKGHPQRVLRAWIWQALSASGGMSAEQLSARAPAFHREHIETTLGLLDSMGLAMEAQGRIWWALDKGEGGVDRLVLDSVAGALVDEPLSSAKIASAMKVAHGVVWDILEELQEAARIVRKKGDLWGLSDQGHEALKAKAAE